MGDTRSLSLIYAFIGTPWHKYTKIALIETMSNWFVLKIVETCSKIVGDPQKSNDVVAFGGNRGICSQGCHYGGCQSRAVAPNDPVYPKTSFRRLNFGPRYRNRQKPVQNVAPPPFKPHLHLNTTNNDDYNENIDFIFLIHSSLAKYLVLNVVLAQASKLVIVRHDVLHKHLSQHFTPNKTKVVRDKHEIIFGTTHTKQRTKKLE